MYEVGRCTANVIAPKIQKDKYADEYVFTFDSNIDVILVVQDFSGSTIIKHGPAPVLSVEKQGQPLLQGLAR